MSIKSFFDENLFNDALNKIRSLKNDSKKEGIYKSMLTWINWLKDTNKITSNKYNYLFSKLETTFNNTFQDMKNDIKNTQVKGEPPFYKNNFILVSLVITITLCITLITYLLVSLHKINTSLLQDKPLGRVLPFKGTIKETDGQPLDTKRDAIFRLYNTATGGNALYSGSCIGANGLEPSFNGSFTILIGSDCGMKPIPESFFKENQSLYLGLTIGNDSEFQPRYQIITSSFSQDSTKLQGLSIGNSKSTIPFINEEGSIEFSHDSPTIKSTNGNFSIEGSALTLRTTQAGSNIIFDPATSSNVIIGSGNLGIGTFNPETYLDVSGSKLIGSIVSFNNFSKEDSVDSSVLKLSLGTEPIGTNAEFIEFYAGKNEIAPGVKVGGIRLNNQSVVYETSAADFAEYFEVDDKNEFKMHEIVSITNRGIKPARLDENIIGVVSNTAGYIGNNKYDNNDSILVALVGQVEVLVTNINGEIGMGDTITTSTINGYGAKSTDGYKSVGYVLQKTDNVLINNNCPQDLKHIKTTYNEELKCGKVRVILDID